MPILHIQAMSRFFIMLPPTIEEAKNKLMQRDFEFFVREFMPYAAKGQSYIDKASYIILDYVRHFIATKDSNLFILEAPPRLGKSVITTVLACCFIAGVNSNQNAMIRFANQGVLDLMMRNIANILCSEKYCKVFGFNPKKIRKSYGNGNCKVFLPNGFKIFAYTSMSGINTGAGYRWIWFDDFLTRQDTESATKMRSLDTQLSGLLSRTEGDRTITQGNSTLTKFFVVNQRLNFNDLSAKFIEAFDNAEQPYMRLKMPYHFRLAGNTTYQLYNGKTISFSENEYLAKHWNIDTEMFAKATVGIAGGGDARFNTEYLQEPTQGSLQMFDISKIQYYDNNDIENLTTVFITTDFAFGQKKSNDATVFIAWGIDKRDIKNPKVYMLDAVYTRSLLDATIPMLETFYKTWCNFTGTNQYATHFTGIYIEDARNEGVIELVRRSNILSGKVRIMKRSGMGKVERADVVLHLWNQNIMYFNKKLTHNEKIVHELRCFSRDMSSKHDDCVDNIVDCLEYECKNLNKVLVSDIYKAQQSTSFMGYSGY
jgi:predicted phage terminase large subunit-like protein